MDLMDPSLRYNLRGRIILIVLTTFLFLDFVAVGLRVYAKRLMRKSMQLNDWALIISLLLVTALYCIEIAVVLRGGLGLHVEWILLNKGMPTLMLAGKLVFAADIVWNLSLMAIKISILHLYLTLFGTVMTKFRHAVYATIALVVVSGTAFIIQMFALCRPLAFFWDKMIVGGKCSDERLAYLIPNIINIVIDFLIFGLPMPLFWGLKVSTRKKIGACVVFSIGLSICILAAVRVKYILELDFNDFTYSLYLFSILGIMEPMLAIISACLPILPPVFAKCKARILGRSPTSTHKSSMPSSSGHSKSLNSAQKSPNAIHIRSDAFDDLEHPLIELQVTGKSNDTLPV